MRKEFLLMLIIMVGAHCWVFSQTPLYTHTGVKTLQNQFTGDLNVNQNWGSVGMSGMYMFNAQTSNHAPTSSDWYHFIEMQHDAGNNWTGQIALGYFTDNLYYRQQNQSTWGAWHTLATQDWVSSLFQNRTVINGSGTNKDTNSDINGDLVVRSNTGSRNTQLGAMLEFVIPANVDGTNPWGQGRIMTVAGNGRNGNATGKMILGTRRMFDKISTGSSWYYGDDLVIDGAGNVGIGTINPREKLSVYGRIRAIEVKVSADNWPDFVFRKDYALPPLEEVEHYIKSNGHLQGFPSRDVVARDGIALGKINNKLLKKVEELTLYLIGQQKQLSSQNEKILLLEREIKLLKK